MSDQVDKIISDAMSLAWDPKPGLEDMLEVVAIARCEIEASERAFILAGLREGDAPYPDKMRKAVVLSALHTFLEACKDRPEDVIKRLRATVKK